MIQNVILSIANGPGRRLALFALALLCSGHLFAQGTAGLITGVVEDSTGKVVPGAKVTAYNQNQKAVTAVDVTNGQGVFVFNPLPVSIYTITVEAPGFKTYTRNDIVLNVNDKIGLPPTILTVGSVSETISVEANTVELETVTATRAGLVDNTQLNDLPIQTRTNVATSYLREIPGSAPDVSSNFNGQRVTDVVNQLDGVTMMDAGNNGVNYSFSIEAVGEVKVTTNAFTAEYGRAAGFQVSSVLKSGTSTLHGSGFWFHQNEGLNANTSMNNMQGIQKPLSRGMLSGFTLGGPVWMPVGPLKRLGRQKLFWFTSFEFHPTKTNTVVTLTVPTAAEAAGNFAGVTSNTSAPITIMNPTTHAPFPGNVVPQNMINPYGQALLSLIAAQDLPNVVGQPQYNHLSTLPVLPSRIWDDIYKVDYNLSEKNRLSGHLLRYHNNNPSYGGLNTLGDVDWSLYSRPDGEWSIALNFVTIFSATMTNEVNYGRSYNFLPTQAPTGSSPYLKANSPGWGSVPVLNGAADPSGMIPGFNFAASNITNAPSFGTNGLPYINKNPISDYVDNLTKMWGTHTVKAGVSIETGTKDQTATADVNGTYNFTLDSSNPGDTGWGFANALLGNFDTYTQASRFINGEYEYRNYEWYVQDSWKARPNLTINYGLRMEVLPPWFEAHNQIAGFFANLYNPAQAVELYQPFCSNGASSCTGSARVARNPATGATLPSAFIGTEVPGIGNQFNGVSQAGANGIPDGMTRSRGIQWAPRIGFSWSPFGTGGKMVVRGGGGVSYNRSEGQMVFNELADPPNLVESSLYYGNVGGLNTSTPLQPVGQSTGNSMDGHIPTVYNFNLGIQRELPWRGLLDVSYVGTIGNHLLTFSPFNNIAPGAAWLPQNQDPTLAVTPSAVLGANALSPNFYRPFLGYAGAVPLAANNTDGSLITFGSNSNYNGLQVSYKKRMSGGIQIGVNYTWSKALGTMSQEFNNSSTATPFGNPVSSVNVKAVNYGPLLYNRTQSLNIDVVYNIPNGAVSNTFLANPVGKAILNGWQLSVIAGYASGAPQDAFFTIQGVSQQVENQEFTGSADIQPRGTLSCNPTTSGPKTQAQWINTSCIGEGLHGSIGADSGSGAFNGLGYRNWDSALMKKFQLGRDSRRYAQLRFEAYNVFNHPEWSGINLTPTFSPATGQITNLPTNGGGIFGYGALNAMRSPGASRNVQIGAKIYF
jgi:carboxypeptidase family protein